MTSEPMVEVLTEYAEKVAKRAGDGYNVFIGKNRANVSVGPGNSQAEQDNLDNNTLLKASGESYDY